MYQVVEKFMVRVTDDDRRCPYCREPSHVRQQPTRIPGLFYCLACYGLWRAEGGSHAGNAPLDQRGR
jgi:hypothetical protein